MIYQDGNPMDAKLRLIECPRCHNTEFSVHASHCRICGFMLYNPCEGDEYEHIHNNPGNARFCETCGAKTRFFLEGILKPYTEAKPVEINTEKDDIGDAPVIKRLAAETDDDQLPF